GAVPSLQRVRIEEAESILHLKEIVDEPVEAEQSQPTALSADELIVQPRQSDSGVDDQDGDEIDGVSADNDLEMLQPGEIVARHYEILSCLGRGGMSAVYKATHVLLDKVV